MNGAVKFGKNPELVASRKSAYAYGIKYSDYFDESKHKAEKKYTANGCDFCADIFLKLVTIGEDVGWNETREHFLYPVEPDQTSMNLTFYRTERKNAKYIDDWGIEEVGSFDVDMTNTSGGRNRKVRLEVKFGSTEITATGTDSVSKSKKTIKIDFLTKP